MIRLELSGVAPENIDVSFHENTLTVSGERSKDVDDVSFYVHERFYGIFRRSMTLPAGVNDDDITAEFNNGLVEITVNDGAAARAPAHPGPQQDRLAGYQRAPASGLSFVGFGVRRRLRFRSTWVEQ